MGNFQSTCPKASIKMVSEYHDLGTCVFGHWKGFGKLETVANFNAYQITKYQILQKLIIFCCMIFEEFKKEILKSRIFKIVPLGAPRPDIQIVQKWKKVFIRTDSLLTMITNSFNILFIQNLETFLFFHFFCNEIYSPFLKVSTKFTMTKIFETQVPSFHAYADIKQCLYISKVYENIHDQKTNKNCP